MPIDGYGDGAFRIGGLVHHGSILLLPERVIEWPVTDLMSLKAEDFDDVIACKDEIEFILIGYGAEVSPIPTKIRGLFEAAGIGIEYMNSGAAARTYNILIAEGRRIAAAIIAV